MDQQILIQKALRQTGMEQSRPVASPINRNISDEQVITSKPFKSEENSQYRKIVDRLMYIGIKRDAINAWKRVC